MLWLCKTIMNWILEYSHTIFIVDCFLTLSIIIVGVMMIIFECQTQSRRKYK